MSLGTTGAPAVATAETPRVRSTARRAVFWVVVVVAALVVAVLTVVLGASATPDTDRYSIENAGPTGSRAVAEVLRQQGVDVVGAASLEEATAALDGAGGSGGAGADATLLVADVYGYLDDDRRAELADLVRSSGADLVLVEPWSSDLDVLAPGIANAGSPEGDDILEAGSGCGIEAAERGGTITAPNATYRPVAAGGDANGGEVDTCFLAGSGDSGDAFALIRSTTANGTVTVFGGGDSLTNGLVAQEGNAALALGLLGGDETLVWYIPGYDDLALDGEAPETLGTLTPVWVTPVLLLLILTTIAAGIWRGRRFGPVVVENLPVTVRASETMEGRARLYAKHSAHGRALDAVRIGTITRLTSMLALPRYAGVVEVSRSVAAVTGRHVDEVYDTIVGAVPRSEAELLALSDRLLLLEQEVSRATTPR
ncbi:DUF4350 domain-containing protein [Herbiconiux liukaitaii]|uniref:DUF4350 domain-containing protein n=1 Tax=Herbiconiux liukaitaii TaxID=3342799 RepID=UPI0035B913FB